jgi:hypothetical protein
VRVPFGKWLRDYIDDTFHLDSRLARSLGLLVRRPGALTQAYVDGQRSAYVRPFRLYLTASFLYFLALAFLAPMELVTVRSDPGASGGEMAVAGGMLRVSAHSKGTWPSPESEQDSRMVRQLKRFFAQGDVAAREKVFRGMVSALPKAMFVFVPVFALLLTLLYRRSGRFYAEHFLFALHFHAFAFLLLSVGLGVGLALSPLVPRDAVRPVVQPLIAGYLFLALRRVYGQSRVRTALKTVVLLACYGFLLLASVTLGTLAAIYYAT